MKFYLQRLKKLNKENLLVKSFQDAFPQLKFEYIVVAYWLATLVVRDKDDNFISEYELTDYNVAKIHYFNSVKNNFEEIISTDAIRKTYIQFMKKTFPEYREDYLNACKNTALVNLGESNSL